MRRLLSALFALLVGAAAVTRWNSPPAELFQFGWEYGNLAEGLVRGHGLADAMAPGSGPSAWMPPLLPCVYALVFGLCGIKTSLACLVLVLVRALWAGLCLYWLLGWFCDRRSQWLAAALAVFGTFLDAPHQLYDLNDVWWAQGWLCLAIELSLRPQRPWLALPLVLASPAATLAMLAGLLPDLGRGRRAAWLLLAWTAVGGLGWGIRNQLTLGHFYPVKSNLQFDFQLANRIDDDGLITLSTIDTAHPIKPNEVRARYLELGEARFLEEYVGSAPEWPRRALRRGLNAFWCLRSEVDEGPALDSSAEENRKGWLVVKEGRPFWLFLDREMPDEPASRRQARQRYQARLESVGGCLWAYWFTLPPTLAALWISQKIPARRRLVACYLGFLLPYVLVQHYARYQVSTLYLQILMQVTALEAFWRDRHGAPEA